MKRWKYIAGLGLSVSLAASSLTYATVEVPPIPYETGQGSSLPGMGTLPGNSTGGNSGSVVTGSAPSGNQANTGPQAGGTSETKENPAPGAGTSPSAGTGSGTTPPTNSSTQNPAQNSGTGTGTENSGKVSVEEPAIQAEGAVLLDAATGKVLYGKNQDKQFYPASITKIMTGLLVIEKCSLNDMVTFSASATTNLESGSVSLNITEGDKLTVEQCLYGLMLKSANEIANGLAEHVSGSVSAFADQMNARAKELGCKNTNFVNPNGLNNSNHVTTPYDMALIARAAFANDTFRKIDTTLSYQFPATKKAEARTITMGHKMMYTTDSRYYEGIIGGKTGYTSLAGNTLVTGADKNGIRLIAVVMKSRSTQYTDTKALLDYGFENYSELTGKASGSGNIAAGSSGSGGGARPGAAASTKGWVQDRNGWQYVKQNGAKASNEWITDQGHDYWFDSDSYMAVGWRQFSSQGWYYFKPSGAKAVNYWAQDNGKWFYLGSDGVMLKNTTTPDGYQVDASGVWIQ